MTVACLFSFLLLYGVLVGNELSVALIFIFPLFTLFNIFIYVELSKCYDLNRYIYHYYLASIFVSLKILLLCYFFTNNIMTEYLPIYDSAIESQPSWIALNAGYVRVFVGQAVIIPIGLLFSYYLYGKISYSLFLISFTALLITQTTVLWIIFLFVFGYLICIHYKSFYKYVYLVFALLFFITFIIISYDQLADVILNKTINSSPVKFAQLDIAGKAIAHNLLFGYGLGHIYSNGSYNIEVVILHVLSTTGIVGFLFYLYMLFYWTVISFIYVKNDRLIRVLFLSYTSIVFASFSNPYLIGGNSGLFLIPIIAARYLQIKKVNPYFPCG